MNSRSKTEPGRFSSAASISFMIPLRTATSPLIRTGNQRSLSFVPPPKNTPAARSGFFRSCGVLNRKLPTSGSGLIETIYPLPEVGNFRFKNPQDLKNPLRAAGVFFGGGTKLSDLWLPLRINGDVAVLKGMMKEMLADEEKRPGSVFDLEFIRNFTAGFDQFVADLRAS